MPTRLLLLAAAAALTVSGTAHAQMFDPAWLDLQAELRNAARGPQPPVPDLPAGRHIPQQVLHRPSQLTICMSTPSWTPIHREADATSPVVGYTTAWVAVTARTKGYAQILLQSGKGVGYVPNKLVTPFHNELNPGGTYTVMLDRDNRPLFQQR